MVSPPALIADDIWLVRDLIKKGGAPSPEGGRGETVHIITRDVEVRAEMVKAAPESTMIPMKQGGPWFKGVPDDPEEASDFSVINANMFPMGSQPPVLGGTDRQKHVRELTYLARED